MNEKEPLKNKEQAIIGSAKRFLKGIKDPCFTKEDIKAAVEWLKENITTPKQKDLMKLIDKAFEDVK